MKLFDLSGRVAAITGTSRGIGRELALSLKREFTDDIRRFLERKWD